MTRYRNRLAVSAALAGAVALLGACADETTGGDAEGGGGTEEVTQHLESLDAAYAEGGTSEVQSHLRALDTAWADAESDVSDSAQVEEMLDSLETQIAEDAPPEEVSATIDEINQSLS
jgi:hypothetical protein